MSLIRPAVPDDMEAVAAMFQRIFRGSSETPNSLVQYLRELLFDTPDLDPDISSLVAISEENIVLGFICVLPLLLRFGARTVRAAVAGSLMVADPARDPLLGARLIRAYINGPQDISLSESANALSRGMWERLGGRTVPAYSMDWFKVLRPSGFAISLVERKLGLARLLRPVGGLADQAFGGHFLPAGETARAIELRDVAHDDPAFAATVTDLSARYALRPAWSEISLSWRLAHAARKRAPGPLLCRLATARGKVIGAYAVYAPRRGIAQVLLLLSAPGSETLVLDRLIEEAAATGCVAVRGRCQPEQLDGVLKAGAVLTSRSSTMIRTKDSEIERSIAEQKAWITGLAGESWIRLIGDDFLDVRTT